MATGVPLDDGKGSGDYGNFRTNQAAFKFGHSGKGKVNAITKVPKSQRQQK